MRMFFVILLSILFSQFLFAQNVFVQNSELVSIDEVLPVIVVQQDSPIKVENFVVTKNASGKIQTDYQVLNASNKPIKSYQIARWFSDNTGYIGSGIMPENGLDLQPQQRVKTYSDLPVFSNKDKGTKPKMKKIVFIIVTEVVFSDGTKYEAKDNFEALEKHLKLFENIYDKSGNE